MASTYKVQEAADIVASTHASRGAENIHTAAALGLSYMWNMWAWPQSLKELPPFWLVPDRMEYGPPISVVPSDFAGLWEAHLVHVQGDSSGPFTQPLDVLRNTSMLRHRMQDLWPPDSIAYIPELGVFRLSSATPSNVGAPEWMVNGTYKTQPTKITAANIGTTLIPFDDKYFGAFVEMVRWKFQQLNGDPRAGQVQVFANGVRQYTGQAAVAHDAVVNAIMENEDVGGSEQLVPERVLTDW